MRTFAFSALAVSALLLSVSCRNEEVPAVPGGATRTITVHTGNANSKTAVYFDGTSEKYKTTWKAGDLIDLFEFSQDGFAYGGSDPLEGDASNASFEVTFETDAPDETPLQYIGVYPRASEVIPSDDDIWFSLWGERPETKRYGLMGLITNYQFPTADSFQPEADLMFSECKELPGRPDDITLAFARVGSIVKITLKGLPAGQSVLLGTLTCGDSWQLAGRVLYDPETGKVAIAPPMAGPTPKKGVSLVDNSLTFAPDDLVVDENGEAVLWLRTLSGTLTDYFFLDMTVGSGSVIKKGKGDDVFTPSSARYGKMVDLAALGKTLSFREGEMTSFSVSLERLYDVNIGLESKTVTANSIGLQCYCDLDGATYENGSFGVLWGDDYSEVVSLTLETASPDRVTALSWDEYGQYLCGTVSGLDPSTYYYFRAFAVLDGKAYYMDYPFSVKTEKAFAVPALVDLGLPSGTQWASFNLGSTAPEEVGDYFAFGETAPARSLYSYANKYWDQSSYYSGTALKYADDSRYSDVLDLKMVLEPEDDAATQLLGSSWRTPTVYDFEELLEYCTYEQVEVESGVYADKYTAANGNYILLPACGNWHWGKKYTDEHCYMTSSICRNLGNALYYYSCASYHHSCSANSADRCYFYNIRPVSGGTARSYEWTAHVDQTPVFLPSGAVEIGGTFYNEEVDGYTYTYKIQVESPSSTETYHDTFTIVGPDGHTSPTGKATLTGLEAGRTYYYRALWTGLMPAGVNTYIKEDGSEWRSFTMPAE